MRIGRSLTVCLSLLLGGGASFLGGSLLAGGPPSWGVSLLGVPPSEGSPYWGGASFLGGLPGRGASFLGGLLGRHPPVNRITHSCKNITFATTSLRPVTSLHMQTLDHEGKNYGEVKSLTISNEIHACLKLETWKMFIVGQATILKCCEFALGTSIM